MKTKEIQIGETYETKVSGSLTHVKIIGPSIHSGWIGKNMSTGRLVRIRTSGRLRRKVGGGDVRLPAYEEQWQALRREHPDTVLLLAVGTARYITHGVDVTRILEVCGPGVFTSRTEGSGLVSAGSIGEIERRMAETGQKVITFGGM